MAKFNLLPHWFAKVHPKFRTPVRTLVVFSGIALIELWLAGLSSNVYDVLANMYAFGAATAYMLVFVSLLVLRFKDPWTPRPFKVPLNIRLRGKDGEARLLPVAGVLGFLGISSILFLVVLTHSIGRIAGPGWIVLGLLLYLWHRHSKKLPLRKSLKRDWTKEQLLVYEDAGEYDMVDEYRENLERKRRLHHETENESVLPIGTKVIDVPIHSNSDNGHRRKRNGGVK
jgi:APA family basic amino acid/polyamine antiporter